MGDVWQPTPIWRGRTVLVVGGGPSLTGFDLSPGRKLPTIAVNNAYQLAPWAEIVFYADHRWLEWHGAKLGPMYRRLVTSNLQTPADVLRVAKHRGPSDGGVWGCDSGHQAVTLAYALGAKRIVLAGFDMRFAGADAHWHPDHPIPSSEGNYRLKMAPQYPELQAWLVGRGVELLRCTPSALDFIPEISLEAACA